MSVARVCSLMAAWYLLGLALFLEPALAEKRVALVIGNGAYAAAGRLTNPENDARDMASALQKLGFEVALTLDASRSSFETAISDFSDKASGADVALVFYAGHGMGLGTETHLLPVDADFRNEFEARNRTIGLTALLGTLEGRAKTVLAFVDACRDNPLADRLAASTRGAGRSVSVTRGLARIDVGASDTLVVYATTPGRTAADGTGRNSPFTTALLAHLGTEGVEIEVLLKRVSARVQELTGNQQEPERLSRLKREFYFKPARNAPIPATSIPDMDSGMRADFGIAQQANTRTVWQAFIDRYKTGFLVDAARDRLGVLAATPTASLSSKSEVAGLPSNMRPTAEIPREFQGIWCAESLHFGGNWIANKSDHDCALNLFTISNNNLKDHQSLTTCIIKDVVKFDVCPWGMIFEDQEKAKKSRPSQINPWGPGYRMVFSCKDSDQNSNINSVEWVKEKEYVRSVTKEYKCPWHRRT